MVNGATQGDGQPKGGDPGHSQGHQLRQAVEPPAAPAPEDGPAERVPERPGRQGSSSSGAPQPVWQLLVVNQGVLQTAAGLCILWRKPLQCGLPRSTPPPQQGGRGCQRSVHEVHVSQPPDSALPEGRPVLLLQQGDHHSSLCEKQFGAQQSVERVHPMMMAPMVQLALMSPGRAARLVGRRAPKGPERVERGRRRTPSWRGTEQYGVSPHPGGRLRDQRSQRERDGKSWRSRGRGRRRIGSAERPGWISMATQLREEDQGGLEEDLEGEGRERRTGEGPRKERHQGCSPS